eukprot:6202462-Pleurochrysis_carterae.AAC.2
MERARARARARACAGVYTCKHARTSSEHALTEASQLVGSRSLHSAVALAARLDGPALASQVAALMASPLPVRMSEARSFRHTCTGDIAVTDEPNWRRVPSSLLAPPRSVSSCPGGGSWCTPLLCRLFPAKRQVATPNLEHVAILRELPCRHLKESSNGCALSWRLQGVEVRIILADSCTSWAHGLDPAGAALLVGYLALLELAEVVVDRVVEGILGQEAALVVAVGEDKDTFGVGGRLEEGGGGGAARARADQDDVELDVVE